MPYFLVDYVRSRQMEAKEVHEEVILKVIFTCLLLILLVSYDLLQKPNLGGSLMGIYS